MSTVDSLFARELAPYCYESIDETLAGRRFVIVIAFGVRCQV